ncbi:GPP34 family phosphoprotein [Nonomuraea longispora]|uniref:GPP34 family phosphoprotein n=1 Tax=Nonomuraea longispora TaxID=1848320 RepID=A0A4R4NPJ2_9ACTN|nr:GPP34 family phosphoprotein [Nonomuraea longispora]TDC11448.1 GPP34 family phosphoprotein [Nonomuraea longispora]
MTVTIAEEFLLLAYRDDKGTPLIDSTRLDSALAGALLAELAVAGRLELSDKKVTVTDPSPLGDAELDATLSRIASETKARKPAWWVQRLKTSKLRNRLLTNLAGSGVLTEERSRALGIFPVTRWPEAHPGVEADVRERAGAVLKGATPDARTAVLIAITHAAKLDRKVFPEADKRRIKEISEGAWTADAVAKTIAAINAATMAAISAATTAAASSSSGGG